MRCAMVILANDAGSMGATAERAPEVRAEDAGSSGGGQQDASTDDCGTPTGTRELRPLSAPGAVQRKIESAAPHEWHKEGSHSRPAVKQGQARVPQLPGQQQPCGAAEVGW